MKKINSQNKIPKLFQMLHELCQINEMNIYSIFFEIREHR